VERQHSQCRAESVYLDACCVSVSALNFTFVDRVTDLRLLEHNASNSPLTANWSNNRLRKVFSSVDNGRWERDVARYVFSFAESINPQTVARQ
jgi:hypothetical protein